MDRIIYLIFAILFFHSLACRSTLVLDKSAENFLGTQMWTATNFRIFQNQYIYWQNYLDGDILPIGMPVRILEVNLQTAIFVDNANQKYILHWQRSPKAPYREFKDEIHKYFLLENPMFKIQKLRDSDRQAIEIGKVQKGMSKETVLFSYGYPINSSPMQEDTWIYWLDHWRQVAVYFENDVVVNIVKQ